MLSEDDLQLYQSEAGFNLDTRRLRIDVAAFSKRGLCSVARYLPSTARLQLHARVCPDAGLDSASGGRSFAGKPQRSTWLRCLTSSVTPTGMLLHGKTHLSLPEVA